MKPFVGEEDTLLEIGCRDDRGVLSAQILDFSRMTILDMTPSRVSLTKNTSQQLNSPEKNQKINFIVADIFGEDIDSIGSYDVVMTTALVHHTSREKIPSLFSIFKKLANKRIIVSGPNKRKQTKLYGDHRYHLDRDDLKKVAGDIGLVETAYLEHDDLAPPIGFFGEAAREMAINGVNIIVYEKG